MKKRNGFTLVELLGVIVVLAILALITIPIISNVINDVRIKSLKTSAYGLIEASNLYYVSKGNNTTIRFDKTEETDTLKELSYKGVVKEGTVIIDKIGQVTVCITDGKNSAYKNYNETQVTTVKGSLCKKNEGSSIVYLDDEATISELSLAELTEKVLNLENNFLDKTYPVGSIYITTTEDTVAKVQAKFGGTWIVFGSGRTLLSSTSDSEQIGGSSIASFTPTGTVGDTTLTVNQIPAHRHLLYGTKDVFSKYGDARSDIDSFLNGDSATVYTYWSNSGTKIARNTGFEGGSQSHTHSFIGNGITIDTVPPYITVYMYKRTY